LVWFGRFGCLVVVSKEKNFSLEPQCQSLLQARVAMYSQAVQVGNPRKSKSDWFGLASCLVFVSLRRYDMNGRFQIQGGKNWILPKEINANRLYWDTHWLEIWSNHL
jgi:hypothetical protein